MYIPLYPILSQCLLVKPPFDLTSHFESEIQHGSSFDLCLWHCLLRPGGCSTLCGWWFGTFYNFPLMQLGMSSSQLTNSYFSEGFVNHQAVKMMCWEHGNSCDEHLVPSVCVCVSENCVRILQTAILNDDQPVEYLIFRRTMTNPFEPTAFMVSRGCSYKFRLNARMICQSYWQRKT